MRTAGRGLIHPPRGGSLKNCGDRTIPSNTTRKIFLASLVCLARTGTIHRNAGNIKATLRVQSPPKDTTNVPPAIPKRVSAVRPLVSEEGTLVNTKAGNNQRKRNAKRGAKKKQS